jgi:alkylhydroperoxidase family enzyme
LPNASRRRARRSELRAAARAHHRVDDATFAAIKNKYSAQWIVELAATVSFFGFIAGIANAGMAVDGVQSVY